MFIKNGDLNSITVIAPDDIDPKSTKKALSKVKKEITDNSILSQETENKVSND
jgi:hypothetical protein